MLDFRPKKTTKAPLFTLDKAQIIRSKAPKDNRRYIHIIFLIAIAIACGFLMWNFITELKQSGTPYAQKLQAEVALEPMVKPTIAQLPPLPAASDIVAHKETVAALISERTVPIWIEQPDASTLAWVGKKNELDALTPPVSQRVEARDFMLRHIKAGSAIMVTGLLEDSQPAPIPEQIPGQNAGPDNGYQHLLLALPGQQYIQVLAPESARELLIGEPVQVIGRYLGFADLPVDPVAEPVSETTTPPVAAAPTAPAGETNTAPVVEPVTKKPRTVNVPYVAARLAAHPKKSIERENPYQLTGNWRMPEDIYSNIDDNLLMIETRPYYYTLGQMLNDRTNPGAFADAKNALKIATDIHRNPENFRGQMFTIQGRVFHAWEDEGVSYDKPFGIDRVVRVIMWSENWGEWDVVDKGQVVTKNKLILRTYELAMITHQPLPKTGDVIAATGRFLRIRSMEVGSDPLKDRAQGIHRHSNRAHTFLFVTGDYELLPPPAGYDFTPLIIIVFVIAAIFATVIIMSSRREGQKSERVQDSVRKLRESRRALEKKKAEEKNLTSPESET
jgi:hypothetical protein